MPGRKPMEQKRRTGRAPGKDSAGRPLPDPTNVRALPGAGERIPEAPATLLEDGAGARRWEKLWREAREWLAPGTDWHLVVRLCEAEDLRQGMREALASTGFFVMGSMGQQRPNPLIDKLRLHDAEILRMERECGLTPAARGALGVGEVQEKASTSGLDAILLAAAARGARKSG